MDFVKDWQEWRSTLDDVFTQSRKLGLSDEKTQQLSDNVGNFLMTKVCPATKEEELLKDMWAVATPEERKVLASLILKMAN
jgi:hypothetical protein